MFNTNNVRLIKVKANITHSFLHAHKTESYQAGQTWIAAWLFPIPVFSFRGPDVSFRRTPWFPQKLTWDVCTAVSCTVFWAFFWKCVQNLHFYSHQIMSQIFHASFWNNFAASSSVCNPFLPPSLPSCLPPSLLSCLPPSLPVPPSPTPSLHSWLPLTGTLLRYYFHLHWQAVPCSQNPFSHFFSYSCFFHAVITTSPCKKVCFSKFLIPSEGPHQIHIGMNCFVLRNWFS